MKKVEVLSPVGDVKSFYASIEAGCDAVYMGLPKFNARMKAENISLENLKDLVDFAHLKQVNVYITLNTLLSNSEMSEAVGLVGDCLRANVDAFIVQDLGLISVLKKVYPSIILHGSTQLGVHNVEGAKVAKELGLSRIVLSRECRLQDIKEIIESVDIETEVFVQGANCICFSGNCYMSSLKCGASGNRGQCKQLCRLPYTLKSRDLSLDGYVLSPRDNCLLPDLKELIKLGVTSLKIEGRLRQVGYVKVATNVYRQAVDSIQSNEGLDIESLESKLYRVFARGKYTSGYNYSNNIVDAKSNNHLGIKIGIVKNVSKFKNLYRVTLDIDKDIVSGDGLKFEKSGNIVSIGVGNIENNGKYKDIFVKNHIENGSNIYLSHDTTFENNIPDKSKYRDLKITARVVAGEKLFVKFSSGDSVVSYVSDAPIESAKNRPITIGNIEEQFSKIDRKVFGNISFDIVCENAFVSLSTLNEVRRELISALLSKILKQYDKSFEEFPTNEIKNLMPKILPRKTTFSNVAIVDETAFVNDLKKYEALILAPKVFSLSVIEKFKESYEKFFSNPLIINLPNIARCDDMVIIRNILDNMKSSNIILIANNIYGLYFSKDYHVWAGSSLNIINDYSATCVQSLGIEEIIASTEKWTSRLSNTYKLTSPTLMTITSCPVKLLYGNDCKNCKYSDTLKYIGQGVAYNVRRYTIKNCYFDLYEPQNEILDGIIDLRKQSK